MGLGTYVPAKVPFFRVPDKPEAGDQLDQLCQEDCSGGDEHVPGPDSIRDTSLFNPSQKVRAGVTWFWHTAWTDPALHSVQLASPG